MGVSEVMANSGFSSLGGGKDGGACSAGGGEGLRGGEAVRRNLF